MEARDVYSLSCLYCVRQNQGYGALNDIVRTTLHSAEIHFILKTVGLFREHSKIYTQENTLIIGKDSTSEGVVPRKIQQVELKCFIL